MAHAVLNLEWREFAANKNRQFLWASVNEITRYVRNANTQHNRNEIVRVRKRRGEKCV